MSAAPTILDWESAPESILNRFSLDRIGVVGVTGPVGAGKSLLTARLCARGGVCLATDDYLPDYDKVAYEDRDDPNRADLGLLIENIRTLRGGKKASVPIWSFQSHSREGYREVSPLPMVVIEGIHALHDRILPHLDLCVFVEAPASVRWKRWEHLEISGQRGWGVDVAKQFFDSVAEPTFAGLAPIYRSRAHFVVRNESGVPGA